MTKRSKFDLNEVRNLSNDEIDAVSGAALIRMVSLRVAGLNIETFYNTSSGNVIGVAGTDDEVMAVVIH